MRGVGQQLGVGLSYLISVLDPELLVLGGRVMEADYVLEGAGVQEFVDRYVQALEPVLDGYRTENKHYATIAVGCTGGKHRSVAVAVELSKRLAQYPRVTVTTTHRDLGRE